MEQENEIIIDISKSLNPETFKETTNILQNAAFSQLTEIIKEHYEKLELANRKNFHALRSHNSIFISGARGSGKTTFLLNIGNAIKGKIGKDPCILDIIDPTLIHDNDNFLSIVLGRVADTVKKRGSNYQNTNDAEPEKEFFNKLAEVAELSEAICNSKQSTGLDNILDEQNALNLEIGIHDLMKKAVDALGCPFLVLPIDDIDMSFVHGFEVLEKIRKYLATPYIVPVISGDIKMYHQIFTVEFFRQMTHNEKLTDEKIWNIYSQRERRLGDNGHLENKDMYFTSKSYDLCDRYLEKVLPRNRRIRLMNVREIIKKNIKITAGADHPWNNKSLSDVLKPIRANFNLYCGYAVRENNVFSDENAPIPLNNLREMLQFLDQIKDAFTQSGVNKALMNKRIMDFYEYGGNSTDGIIFDFARGNCIAYGEEPSIEAENKKSEVKFSIKRFAQNENLVKYFPYKNTRNKIVPYYPKPQNKSNKSCNKNRFKFPSNNLEKLFYIITFEEEITNASRIFVSPDKFFLWTTAKLFSPSDISNAKEEYSFGFDNKIFQNDHIDDSELELDEDDEKRADEYEQIKYEGLTNKEAYIDDFGSFAQADCSAPFIYCLYSKFKENIDEILFYLKKNGGICTFTEFAKKLIIVYVNAFAISTTQSKRYSPNNICINTSDVPVLESKDMAFKWNISSWKHENSESEEANKIIKYLQNFLNKNSGSEKEKVNNSDQTTSKEESLNNLLLDFLDRLLEIFGLKDGEPSTFLENIRIDKSKNSTKKPKVKLNPKEQLKRQIKTNFTNYVQELKTNVSDDTELIKKILESKEFKMLKDAMPFPKYWGKKTRNLLGDSVYEKTVGTLK